MREVRPAARQAERGQQGQGEALPSKRQGEGGSFAEQWNAWRLGQLAFDWNVKNELGMSMEKSIQNELGMAKTSHMPLKRNWFLAMPIIVKRQYLNSFLTSPSCFWFISPYMLCLPLPASRERASLLACLRDAVRCRLAAEGSLLETAIIRKAVLETRATRNKRRLKSNASFAWSSNPLSISLPKRAFLFFRDDHLPLNAVYYHKKSCFHSILPPKELCFPPLIPETILSLEQQLREAAKATKAKARQHLQEVRLLLLHNRSK